MAKRGAGATLAKARAVLEKAGDSISAEAKKALSERVAEAQALESAVKKLKAEHSGKKAAFDESAEELSSLLKRVEKEIEAKQKLAKATVAAQKAIAKTMTPKQPKAPKQPKGAKDKAPVKAEKKA
jgi:hypothetical protein